MVEVHTTPQGAKKHPLAHLIVNMGPLNLERPFLVILAHMYGSSKTLGPLCGFIGSDSL